MLRLRAGTLTLDAFASEFDAVLRLLRASKERELPNAAIGPRFFAEPFTVGKLPYWRGMLLAAKWNSEIRSASHGRRSLDDAMRRLRTQYLAGDELLTPERIANVMHDEGVPDAGGDIERFVERGQTLTLAEDALGPCIRIGLEAPSVFDAVQSSSSLLGEPDGRQHVAVREGLDASQRATCLAEFNVYAH